MFRAGTSRQATGSKPAVPACGRRISRRRYPGGGGSRSVPGAGIVRPPRGRGDTPDMRPHDPTSPGRILALLAGVLILKVTASVVSNYHNYLPPNFASDFLRGR